MVFPAAFHENVGGITSASPFAPRKNVLMTHLEQLHERLTPLKAALLNHPVYHEIDCLESLHVFMEHHVFAVWDFMSLLKTLQRLVSCVDVPWLPGNDALGCRFINEIVVAEESDSDGQGGFASHFELYRRAMKQCGANTTVIDGFLNALREGQPLPAAANAKRIAPCIADSISRPSSSSKQAISAPSPRPSRSAGKICCPRYSSESSTS